MSDDGAKKDELASDLPELTPEDELAIALSKGREELGGGRPQEAADHLEEAIAMARQVGDDRGEAEAGGLLTQAYLRLGLMDEAARQASDALEIAHARRDDEAIQRLQGLIQIAQSRPEEAEMSVAFGDGREALLQGNPEQAAERLEHALSLAKKLEHSVAEGATTQLLAQAYLESGQTQEAARVAELAMQLSEKLGDDEATERAQTLKEQAAAPDSCPIEDGLAVELKEGQSALASGDIEGGAAHLERARDLANSQEELIPEASACGMLAQAYLELGRREEAISHAQRALEIAEKLGHEEAARDFTELLEVATADPERLAIAQAIQLGASALSVDETQRATEHLEEALRLAKEQGEENTLVIASGLLARAYLRLGRLDEAKTIAKDALKLSEEGQEEEAKKHFTELLTEIEEAKSSLN